MVCQTIASRPVEPGKESELSRDEIQCKIIYAANGEDTVEALVMYQPLSGFVILQVMKSWAGA